MQGKPQQSGSVYQPGDIYSFRTSPATEFSPKETGRYAALKVLGFQEGRVFCVVLDGIFQQPPELAQVSGLPWLIRSRFRFRGDPAWHCTPLDWTNDLKEFSYVGRGELSHAELALMRTYAGYGTWAGASIDAEGEWRWRHDRAAYEDEVRRAEQEREAERERYEKRLKGLTWEQLLGEDPFARWNRHPPFPAPAFTAAARAHIHATIRELQALGPRPPKANVRAVLRACVEWFNEKDREFGGVIETEEREDICEVLRELAVVARQRSLAEEVDEWRTW